MSKWREVGKDDGGMSVGVSRTRDHNAMDFVVVVVVAVVAAVVAVAVVGCSDPGSSRCAGHRWGSLVLLVCATAKKV